MKKLLILSLLLLGCNEHNKELVKANGEKLCSCNDGLWYIEDSMIKCNNGFVFHNVHRLEIIDSGCKK